MIACDARLLSVVYEMVHGLEVRAASHELEV